MRPFHFAFPVTDLEATRHFYGTVLGCRIGRELAGKWIDFDLYGNQLSAHLGKPASEGGATGSVDGVPVPIPHFGVILAPDEFAELVDRLEKAPDTRWHIRPQTRFAGGPGEQQTLFVFDPSGNALEFKAFADDKAIFAA